MIFFKSLVICSLTLRLKSSLFKSVRAIQIELEFASIGF